MGARATTNAAPRPFDGPIRTLQIRGSFDDNGHMATNPPGSPSYDDPRRLRDLLERARGLAADHQLTSVMVGLAGFEGDPIFPEIVNFVESALRVDDSVFHMTRERAVLLLTDVDQERADQILQRILEDFRESFPSTAPPAVALGYFEISEASPDASAKDVLPRVFAAPPKSH